jgi:hypothetical protein
MSDRNEVSQHEEVRSWMTDVTLLQGWIKNAVVHCHHVHCRTVTSYVFPVSHAAISCYRIHCCIGGLSNDKSIHFINNKNAAYFFVAAFFGLHFLNY